LKKGNAMIALTVIATIFLFVYLVAALLRPEWF
jgi:K+-transporting ATPase KdpF subunit